MQHDEQRGGKPLLPQLVTFFVAETAASKSTAILERDVNLKHKHTRIQTQYLFAQTLTNPPPQRPCGTAWPSHKQKRIGSKLVM